LQKNPDLTEQARGFRACTDFISGILFDYLNKIFFFAATNRNYEIKIPKNLVVAYFSVGTP
jgi:hypothetical protein